MRLNINNNKKRLQERIQENGIIEGEVDWLLLRFYDKSYFIISQSSINFISQSSFYRQYFAHRILGNSMQ